jgi:hypothetical protein
MNCNFKKPTGINCNLPALPKGKYCCLHDKKSISLYFIQDSKKYKKGSILLGTTIANGMRLIKDSVAIELDRKLYREALDKEKTTPRVTQRKGELIKTI